MPAVSNLSRTEYRRRMRDGSRPAQNPNDAWVAPEHAKLSSCRRIRRAVKAEDGTVVVPANTLIMPEPECWRAQRESERILRINNNIKEQQHEIHHH